MTPHTKKDIADKLMSLGFQFDDVFLCYILDRHLKIDNELKNELQVDVVTNGIKWQTSKHNGFISVEKVMQSNELTALLKSIE